jgi:hypothetical protein
MQTLAPWQGLLEWSFQSFRITFVQRGMRRMDVFSSGNDREECSIPETARTLNKHHARQDAATRSYGNPDKSQELFWRNPALDEKRPIAVSFRNFKAFVAANLCNLLACTLTSGVAWIRNWLSTELSTVVVN